MSEPQPEWGEIIENPEPRLYSLHAGPQVDPLMDSKEGRQALRDVVAEYNLRHGTNYVVRFDEDELKGVSNSAILLP